MKKQFAAAITGIFLFFIALFFILNIAIPDITFSQRENRYLTTLPRFSLSALIEGKYIGEFEDYSVDQFPFRDLWVTLKAAIESASGKKENNGVFLSGDTLVLPYTSAGFSELISKNVSAVQNLADQLDIPVYFSLVPSSAELRRELLPKNAPNDSQAAAIQEIYTALDLVTVDILAALGHHKDEYIYFRTDHHWTTLGAYYAYQAIMNTLDIEPRLLSDFTPWRVTEEFYGTAYSSSGYSWIRPDYIDLYVKPHEGLTIYNFMNGEAEAGLLYDERYLDQKDKYSLFFGGNTPLLQIYTGIENDERILFIRDSYMDSVAPFLFTHFSEIHMMDLRYYKASVLEYIAENDITQVFICYSLANFSTDNNVFLLSR